MCMCLSNNVKEEKPDKSPWDPKAQGWLGTEAGIHIHQLPVLCNFQDHLTEIPTQVLMLFPTLAATLVPFQTLVSTAETADAAVSLSWKGWKDLVSLQPEK